MCGKSLAPIASAPAAPVVPAVPAAPVAPVLQAPVEAPAAPVAPVLQAPVEAPAAPVAPVLQAPVEAPAAPVAPVLQAPVEAPAAPVAPMAEPFAPSLAGIAAAPRAPKAPKVKTAGGKKGLVLWLSIGGGVLLIGIVVLILFLTGVFGGKSGLPAYNHHIYGSFTVGETVDLDKAQKISIINNTTEAYIYTDMNLETGEYYITGYVIRDNGAGSIDGVLVSDPYNVHYNFDTVQNYIDKYGEENIIFEGGSSMLLMVPFGPNGVMNPVDFERESMIADISPDVYEEFCRTHYVLTAVIEGNVPTRISVYTYDLFKRYES